MKECMYYTPSLRQGANQRFDVWKLVHDRDFWLADQAVAFTFQPFSFS